MNTFFYLSLLLFITNGIVIFLLIKNKIKLKKIIEIVNNDISEQRKGTYKHIVTLCNEDNKQQKNAYTMIIYVKELDRYTNGKSKIEITDIEITSGFHPDKYHYVKQCARSQFSSLKTTSDIEWLESENLIKEKRKKKLEKINKIK